MTASQPTPPWRPRLDRPSLRAIRSTTRPREPRSPKSRPSAPTPHDDRPVVRCMRCDRVASPSPVDPRVCVQCPRPWILCARCGRTGMASEPDPQLCVGCQPVPEVTAKLEWVAQKRYAAARAGVRPVPLRTALAEAPDLDHMWVLQDRWVAPHLFKIGRSISYCGRGDATEPVHLGRLRPAVESLEGCSRCWAVWHASVWEGR